MIYIGNTLAECLNIGTVAVGRAYLGDVLVFQKSQPYLRIEPEVTWIYEDLETSNEVFSNTSWNIN